MKASKALHQPPHQPLDLTRRRVRVLAQIAVGLPFLAGNASAYLRGAYNLGRNLLWDKSRVFKFVGRGEIRE